MIPPIPLPRNENAPCAARTFRKNLYSNNGLPKLIASDRDIIPLSRLRRSIFKLIDKKLSQYSEKHPQTDLKAEKGNRKVEKIVRACANFDKSHWEENVFDLKLAHNYSFHSTIIYNFLFFNYLILRPVSLKPYLQNFFLYSLSLLYLKLNPIITRKGNKQKWFGCQIG